MCSVVSKPVHAKCTVSVSLLIPLGVAGGHRNAIASTKQRVSWRRLFNMETDGRSFYRLLHCVQLQGPTLFICKDTSGSVFGAFAGESWGEPRTTSFGGARNSFLFRLEPEVGFYWATGEDTNYQYLSTGSAGGRQRRPWAADTPLALEPEARKEVQLPQQDDSRCEQSA